MANLNKNICNQHLVIRMTVEIKRIKLSNASILLVSDQSEFKLKEIVLSIPSKDFKSATSIQFFPKFSQNYISKILAEQSSIILNESILLISNITNPTESIARSILEKVKELNQFE